MAVILLTWPKVFYTIRECLIILLNKGTSLTCEFVSSDCKPKFRACWVRDVEWTSGPVSNSNVGYHGFSAESVLFVIYYLSWASLVAPMVKNLPATWETWVRSLGLKDPLEEVMATHSSILVWRIPMDGGAWWATVHGVTKSQTQLSD